MHSIWPHGIPKVGGTIGCRGSGQQTQQERAKVSRGIIAQHKFKPVSLPPAMAKHSTPLAPAPAAPPTTLGATSQTQHAI